MPRRKNQTAEPTAGAARTRSFGTLVYPTQEEYEQYYESCGGQIADTQGELHTVDKYDGRNGWGTHPDNWLEILSDAHVVYIISPMHIGDPDPDGGIKKPHWHVMVIYEGPKSWLTQVKPFFESFGGVGRQELQSTVGYARYLCHLDEGPEKFHYNVADVIEGGAADYLQLIDTPKDTLTVVGEIMDYVDAHNVRSFAALCRYARSARPDWFRVITEKRGYIVEKYIKSHAWELDTAQGEHKS